MSVHVHRLSQGPRALIALHGWAGSGELYAPLARLLEGSFTVLAPDLPGYGGSSHPAEWDLAAIAGEIAESLRVGLQRCEGPPVILGTCSGAIVGLHVARVLAASGRPPVRLVLAEMFASVPWYFRVFLAPLVGGLAYRATFDNPLGRWLTDRALAGRSGGAAATTGGFDRAAAGTTLPWLRLLRDAGPPERYADLQLPVTLVTGTDTFAAVKADVARWRRLWSALDHVEISGAGHLVVEDAPQALAVVLDGQALLPAPADRPAHDAPEADRPSGGHPRLARAPVLSPPGPRQAVHPPAVHPPAVHPPAVHPQHPSSVHPQQPSSVHPQHPSSGAPA